MLKANIQQVIDLPEIGSVFYSNARESIRVIEGLSVTRERGTIKVKYSIPGEVGFSSMDAEDLLHNIERGEWLFIYCPPRKDT